MTPRYADFDLGTIFSEPRNADFVARIILIDNFVTNAIFNKPRNDDFVANTIL